MTDLVELFTKEFTYNPETGVLKWRFSGKGRRPDLVAGTKNPHGYLIVMLNLRRYMVHHVAWAICYGEMPPREMDHINRDPSDNRICNLRLVEHSQNLMNSKTRTDNTSGHRGICWDFQKHKWKVQISRKGESRRLQKHFVEFNDAVDFYRSRSGELFGEYAAR